MMNLTETTIETSRLLLVPVDYCNAQIMFETFTPQVTRYMYAKSPSHIDETLAHVQEARGQLAAGTDLQLVVTLKGSGEFLGRVGLHHIGRPDPELGIWIKTGAHGHGYGPEAVTGVIDWAKSNIAFDRLLYPADRQNHPSRRIAERNGGVLMNEYKRLNGSGLELDLVEYWIYGATDS